MRNPIKTNKSLTVECCDLLSKLYLRHIKNSVNTAATRHQSAQLNGSLDSDAVVDKLNELNETIRNLKIYTSIDDIRKADKRYTYIEQMAKI